MKLKTNKMKPKLFNAIILEGETYELRRTDFRDVCACCDLRKKCRDIKVEDIGFCFLFYAPFDSRFVKIQ